MELLMRLLEVSSPSKYEKPVQDIVTEELDKYGLAYQIDGIGNVWTGIPLDDGSAPQTLFTAHMDCVHNHEDVLPVFARTRDTQQLIIKLSMRSNQRALGGDDKVGVRLLLQMLKERTSGLYVFTVEEECGCNGADHAAAQCPDYIKNAICFDRKGVDSIITSMYGGVCVSPAFASDLIDEFKRVGLEYRRDPTGSVTDTASFKNKVNNYTNISCGYFSQHTVNEYISVEFFTKLRDVVADIDWQGLSTEKRPAYRQYGAGWGNSQPYKSFRTLVVEVLKDAPDVYTALEALNLLLDERNSAFYPREIQAGIGELLDCFSITDDSTMPPDAGGSTIQ